MPETLDSYLVRLGFDPDMVSYAKFSGVIRDASSLVGDQFGGMVKKVLEWQTGLTGAFVGAGTAALGLADSVAMSDQSYRLLALHMYTSLPVARELKIALDALGEPLENVMWDPELARRFQQLVKDQQEMTTQLGPDFENQMLRIRDMRFEFVRFGVELKYLTMEVVKLLAESFGTSVDGLLEKMRNFNKWFIENMPAIAGWLSERLKPILVDIRQVLSATWGMLKQVTLDFIHFIGFVNNDTALTKAGLSFKNLGTAIDELTGDITKALLALIGVEKNLALLFDAGIQALSGNWKQASADLHAMAPVAGTMGAADKEALARAYGYGNRQTDILAALGFNPPALGMDAAHTAAMALPLALQAGKTLGIPPDLILSQWAFETGGFEQLSNANNLAGIKGKGSSGTNLGGFAGYASLQDFANAYVRTIQKDFPKALGAKDINQFVAGLYAGRLGVYSSTATAQQYAAGVQRFESQLFPGSQQITININVKTDADPKEIANQVKKSLDNTQKKRTQRNLTEFALPGTSY